MEQLRRNLESFYRVIQQALIRHGYVDQERDKLSFCFSKKFRYGRFTFSFRLEPVTSSVEVEPVRVYFDAVEAIIEGLDYPDKTNKWGTICDELPEELISLHERIKQSPTQDLALALGVATFRYIEEGIKQFEQDHSIPSNIIEELEYRDFWAMAFNGSPPEAMFRGLIFYQLMSPELLPDKLHQSDQIFESRELVPDDAWRISYRVLKEKLPRWKAYSTDVSAHSFTVPSRFHSAFSLKAIWEYIKSYIRMK